MALGPVTLLFLAFALPSSALALLAVRGFVLRGGARGPSQLRAPVRLLLLAAALPPALVALATLATQGAPLANPRGWVFLGYGIVAAALGPLGAWLFRRAAIDPRRPWRKAAETVPLVLVAMNLALVATAALEAPGSP